MLYGRPTKHIRHVDETTFSLEPQRFITLGLWNYSDSATARTDGLDLQNEKKAPEGSIVTKHKLEVLITPETIEPQQVYMGRLKLSFADVHNHAICGGRWEQGSYGDTTNDEITNKSNPITPHLYGDLGATDGKYEVKGFDSVNQEIGGSGSGYGIKEWLLDDHIKHWLNLKKVTVFDQRPLMGERWQRIPSKVKRINEGTFYGLFFFNDSTRGATPADTQITINVKSYWEEKAL